MDSQRPYFKIVDQIKAKFDAGVYLAGDKLPKERELAELYGVSRTVIRDAKAVLLAQGLIENRRGSGTFVLAKANQIKVRLPIISEVELTDARMLLESETAAMAVFNISDETIEKLERYIDIMSGKTWDKMTPNQADRAFHITIAEATNNAAVTVCVESLWDMRTFPKTPNESSKKDHDAEFKKRIIEHRAILDALKKRDSGGARLAMRSHCEKVKEVILKAS